MDAGRSKNDVLLHPRIRRCGQPGPTGSPSERDHDQDPKEPRASAFRCPVLASPTCSARSSQLPGKHRSTGTFVTRVRRRLSLAHVHDTTGTRSQDLDQAQVDAVTITGFLHHLKTRTAGLQGDLAAKSSPHSGSNRRSPSSDPKGGPPGQTQPQTHAEPGITVGDDALHTVRDRRRNAAPASLRTGTLVSSEPFAFVVP